MQQSWSDHIQIDRAWVSKQLEDQFTLSEPKLNIRVYTIKFSGNLQSSSALIETLTLMVKHYVYNPKRIAELGSDKAFLQAMAYFGDKDPTTDGKYGELILFALVEAVLSCKMIAHKIRCLSNYNDQVKGGDGIFLGDYNTGDIHQKAYFIGESKIMGKRSDSISSCFDSLDKFHNMVSSPAFINMEFIVAKENITDYDSMDYEEIFDRLTPSTERFKEQILVHPILLMFNTARIDNIETIATTNKQAEELMNKYANTQKEACVNYIKKALENYPEIQKVFLDFFIIPIKNVNEFRHSFYTSLHHTTYKKH